MRHLMGLLLFAGWACAQPPDTQPLFDTKLSGSQRNDTCFALRGDRSDDVLQAMRSALNVEVVRACAAKNLEVAGAATLLADALVDPSPEVRAVAAYHLGALHRQESLPLLARAAEDRNLLVSTSATQAMCEYEDLSVMPLLRAIAGRGGIPAAIALSRMAALDPGQSLVLARKLLESPDVTERLLALRIIGDAGDAADLPALEEMAGHKTEFAARQRGFGLMPSIDLSRAAQATIAQIRGREARKK